KAALVIAHEVVRDDGSFNTLERIWLSFPFHKPLNSRTGSDEQGSVFSFGESLDAIGLFWHLKFLQRLGFPAEEAIGKTGPQSPFPILIYSENGVPDGPVFTEALDFGLPNRAKPSARHAVPSRPNRPFTILEEDRNDVSVKLGNLF